MNCPCTRDCKNRTATYKTDGSCPNGFAEYERQRMNRYKAQDYEREMDFRGWPVIKRRSR